MFTLLYSLLLCLAHATPSGAELALILDTSGSMAAGGTVTHSDGSTEQLPPNDPERASILGALVIEGLMRGGSDGYQLYFLPKSAKGKAPLANSYSEIHDVQFNNNTFVKAPLQQSVTQLTQSSKRDKTIIFLTDGSPTDIKNPTVELQSIFPADRDFSIFAIGLYQSQVAEDMGKQFLEVLTDEKQDILKLTDNPSDVVPFFMEGFAKVLGSKPEISKISNTNNQSLSIPKYVTEVFIALTSDQANDSFQSTVTTDQGSISPTSAGDNNCALTKNCRYFETYRIAHDPMKQSTMNLSLSGASNPINYSVIYRYDLSINVVSPKSVEVGDVMTINANLVFQNAVFADADFFEQDRFEAFVEIGEETIPLEHRGNGQFQALYTPTDPTSNEKVTVSFKNDWMEQKSTTKVDFTGTLDLRLVVPNINLGAWSGDGVPVQKCQTIDISQSNHADVIPLACTVENLPSAYVGTCTPSAAHPVPPGKQPLHFDVCVETPGCCVGNEDKPGSLWLRPIPSRYSDKASETRITYSVEETSFWDCYWKEILITIGTILTILIIYGYKSPHDFPEGFAFKQAKKRRSLTNASTEFAKEKRNGKSGFYRNARIALDIHGDIVSDTKTAVMVLEAGPVGTTVFKKGIDLEFYDPNKRKWILLEPEDLLMGHKHNGIYRCSGRVYTFF